MFCAKRITENLCNVVSYSVSILGYAWRHVEEFGVCCENVGYTSCAKLPDVRGMLARVYCLVKSWAKYSYDQDASKSKEKHFGITLAARPY